jgi:eukaryotic-like serine/threonine-protein kinase
VGFVAGELIGRVIGGRFRLEALVGRGATAEVYLAVDTRLRRRVAVKVLHPAVAEDQQFLRRFRSEAQLASRLTHPNILTIHDWNDGQGADPAHLITEFLDGGSLRSMLDTHRRLSLSQVTLIGIEAARALTYAHGEGIVHRDIKPANLLFAVDGTLRIGDFGLARAIAEAAMTEPEGGLVGTARYSAPEQALSSAVDGRADVYSLAVTLIEAAIGESPFRGDTSLAVLLERQRRSIVAPASMGALGEVLSAAGVVDPDKRIDAAELLKRLERITHQLPRPDRLPLVTTSGVRSIVDDDPTVHQHEAVQAPGVSSVSSVSAPETSKPTDDVAAAVASVSALSSAEPPASSDSSGSVSSLLPEPVIPEPSLPDSAPTDSAPTDSAPMDSAPTDSATPKGSSRRAVLIGGAALLVGGIGAGSAWRWKTTRPEYRVVPNVTGLAASTAQETVTSLQLSWTATEQFDERVPAGQVLTQLPAAGSQVLKASGVTAVVSKGPQPRTVPTLVGLSEADAAALAKSEQLQTAVRSRIFDEAIPAGQVTAAQPTSGKLQRGGTILIDVSDGPAPREVPNITGMTPAQAKQALPDGLTGVIVEQPSETVDKGVVIAANYKPTTKLPKGSTVKILVSSGPRLIPIPATKGLDVVTASKRLRDAGFVVAGSEGAPDQPVRGTRPAAGKEVRKGTEVVVLTGPTGPTGPDNSTDDQPASTVARRAPSATTTRP